MRIGQKLSIPVLTISFSNAITGIVRGEPLLAFPFHVGMYLAIGIYLYFLKRKNVNNQLSIIILFISLLVQSQVKDIELSGVLLFLLALIVMDKNLKKMLIFSFLFLLSTVWKYSTFEFIPSQLVCYVAGAATIAIITHNYVWIPLQKCKQIKNSDILVPDLKTDGKVKLQVAQIVYLKCKGYDWPEINAILELNVTDDRVRRIVADERKRLGFPSPESFVYWITKTGIIEPIVDSSDI